MDDYNRQARKFLKDTKTTISIEFKNYGKHFANDTQKRNIYTVLLKRNNQEFNFDFGQSITNSEKGIKPSAYSVLSCLTKNDPENHENFCDEYGYNIDSIADKKIYIAVKKEWKKVNLLFSDCLEELQLIQ